jgi:hypothetical protein
MKKIFSQLIITHFIYAGCFAQIIHSPVQPQYLQFGAYSKNFLDAFSFISNQASLSSLKEISAGAYAEQRFLLKELNITTLAIAVPIKNGGLGFTTNYFGNENYNELQAGIAYAKKLGSMADIGIQFDYYAIKIPGYTNYNTVIFEVATIFHPTEKLNIGFQIYNPAGGKLGKNSNEKLASIYKAGMGYEVSDQVFINAQIIKEENKPVDVNAGLQYIFANQFFARIGISSATATPYAGAGFHWKNFRLDATVSYHPQLGFSPGLMLIYFFKKEINKPNPLP